MNPKQQAVPIFQKVDNVLKQVGSHQLMEAVRIGYKLWNHTVPTEEIVVMRSVRKLRCAGVVWIYCGPCTGKSYLLKRYPRAFVDTDEMLHTRYPLLRRAILHRRPVGKDVSGIHQIGDPDAHWLINPSEALNTEIEQFIRYTLRAASDRIVLSNLPLSHLQLVNCTRQAISALPCVCVTEPTDLMRRWSSRAIFSDTPTLAAVSKFIADEQKWIQIIEGINVSLEGGAYLADYISYLAPHVDKLVK